MNIIEPSYEILTQLNGIEILKQIERIGRVCYKSEDRITEDSYLKFIKMIIERGHEAMIEHFSFSVKFVCDRSISHEIIRHRLASFAQSSTRYCNFSQDKFGNQITVIKPTFWDIGSQMFDLWQVSCEKAEETYFKLLSSGGKPEEARSVLPNSLMTEIIMTANLREWRHFFKLRTAKTAHPQMRELTIPLLKDLKQLIPIIFDDIVV